MALLGALKMERQGGARGGGASRDEDVLDNHGGMFDGCADLPKTTGQHGHADSFSRPIKRAFLDP